MVPAPRRLKDLAKGSVVLQPLFERLHRVALTGMNVGRGGSIETSGELHLLGSLARAHRGSGRATPFVVFDIGANVGEYARAVLDRFGGDAFVHAFEPGEDAFAALERSLAGDPRVRLNNAALGREDGTLAIYSPAPASTVASAYRATVELWSSGPLLEESVSMRSLDSYCAEAGIASIDLLKVDVEGHELAVLEGAAQLVQARAIRWLQWEFGACHVEARTFLRDFFRLLEPDYRIHRLLRDGLREVRYTATAEVFSTTNFVAELRGAPDY